MRMPQPTVPMDLPSANKAKLKGPPTIFVSILKIARSATIKLFIQRQATGAKAIEAHLKAFIQGLTMRLNMLFGERRDHSTTRSFLQKTLLNQKRLVNFF